MGSGLGGCWGKGRDVDVAVDMRAGGGECFGCVLGDVWHGGWW